MERDTPVHPDAEGRQQEPTDETTVGDMDERAAVPVLDDGDHVHADGTTASVCEEFVELCVSEVPKLSLEGQRRVFRSIANDVKQGDANLSAVCSALKLLVCGTVLVGAGAVIAAQHYINDRRTTEDELEKRIFQIERDKDSMDGQNEALLSELFAAIVEQDAMAAKCKEREEENKAMAAKCKEQEEENKAMAAECEDKSARLRALTASLVSRKTVDEMENGIMRYIWKGCRGKGIEIQSLRNLDRVLKFIDGHPVPDPRKGDGHCCAETAVDKFKALPNETRETTFKRWRDLMEVHPNILIPITFVKKVGTDVSHPTVTADGNIDVRMGVEDELPAHVEEIRAAYTYVLQRGKEF